MTKRREEVVRSLLRRSAIEMTTARREQRRIGPEGDFTPDEVALAQGQGAVLVSLGPLTLRSETAALAVLAFLQLSS